MERPLLLRVRKRRQRYVHRAKRRSGLLPVFFVCFDEWRWLERFHVPSSFFLTSFVFLCLLCLLSLALVFPCRRLPPPCPPRSRLLPFPEQPTPPTPPPSGGFLRTNGDVIKFGAALLIGAFAFKAVLEAAGIPDLKAGQLTTGLVSVAGLVGWVGTYFYRVGSKKMTYATQLREYEAGVIAKRYAELTPEELDALAEELESEKGG